MIALLIGALLGAAFTFMQKVFAHYNLIRSNDPLLKGIDFGDFFYSKFFSRHRFKVMVKLYSLRFINDANHQLIDPNGDVVRINRYIRLTFLFVAISVFILVVGFLTGLIK
jgi:hypothetical protein